MKGRKERPRSVAGLVRAVRQAEAAIERWSKAGDEASALEELGLAYQDLGECLTRLERYSEAVVPLETAFQILWTVPNQQGRAVQSRVRMIGVLVALARNEDALRTADEVIDLGGEVRGFPEVMQSAALWRVMALRKLGRDREALDGARRLIARYSPGTTGLQRLYVAQALEAQTELALNLGDWKDTARAATKLLTDYGRDESEELQAICANARLTLGAVFEEQEIPGDARKAYEAVLAQSALTRSSLLDAAATTAKQALENLPTDQ